MSWLRRNWFLVGLGFVCLLGLAVPEIGPPLRGWTSVTVAVILFLVGLEQHYEALRRSFFNWSAIGMTLAFSFLAAPLLAWGIGRLLYSADHPLFHGLVLLAAVPTTVASSVVWTRLAGGNTALSVVLVLSSTLASIVLLPWILLWLLGQSVQLPAGEMMGKLLLTVALPIALAQVTNAVLPAARRLGSSAATAGQFLILILILTAVADAAPVLEPWVILEVSGSTAALHVGLSLSVLALTGWLNVKAGERTAIFFAASQKTITVALLIGLSYFSGLAALASVIYHVIQNFASVFWVRWFQGKRVRLAEGGLGGLG